MQLLAAGLPDGAYRYESVSVFLLTPAAGSEAEAQGENEGMARSFGEFKVKQGQLVLPEQQAGTGLLEALGSQALAATGRLLGLLVNQAHAQDQFVADATPQIFFDDTTSASLLDWEIEASANADDLSGIFRIDNSINNNTQTVFQINSDSTTNNSNSMVIFGDGDIT